MYAINFEMKYREVRMIEQFLGFFSYFNKALVKNLYFILMKFSMFLLFSALCATVAAEKTNPESYLINEMPESWQMTPQTQPVLPTDDEWWHIFKDRLLDHLIAKAIDNNFNLASALKRIEIARKGITEAKSGYAPTISLLGGWSTNQDSGLTERIKEDPSRSYYYSLGATMNWEIDVFGRVRAGVEAKKAAYNASKADYNAVMLSLVADLASAYMQLRVCQKQLGVARAHISSQERVVRLTEARFEAELGSMLDVTQARIVLYNTRSTLPALKSQIKTLINTISVLVGEYPVDVAEELQIEKPLPDYKQEIEAGVPTDILRRRPDILEAEMTLGGYAARVGIARKDFLPTLVLTGSIGSDAHHFGDLLSKNSVSYNIAPQLNWTIFEGMARSARSAEAKLQFEAAIDNYNMTVMNAVEEVDNSLQTYSSSLEGIDLQLLVVDESERSLTMAINLYKTGLTAFSNVVDGQMNWLESQSTLVTMEGKALQGLIDLYRALGGGWQSSGN